MNTYHLYGRILHVRINQHSSTRKCVGRTHGRHESRRRILSGNDHLVIPRTSQGLSNPTTTGPTMTELWRRCGSVGSRVVGRFTIKFIITTSIMKVSSASCPCRRLVLAVWWASSLSLASGFSLVPPLMVSTRSMSTVDGTVTSAVSPSSTGTKTRRTPRVSNLMASRELEESSSWKVVTSKFLLSSLSSFLLLFVPITATTTMMLVQSPQPAYADGSTVVGKLQGSGLVFKDTLQIQRFEGA